MYAGAVSLLIHKVAARKYCQPIVCCLHVSRDDGRQVPEMWIGDNNGDAHSPQQKNKYIKNKNKIKINKYKNKIK